MELMAHGDYDAWKPEKLALNSGRSFAYRLEVIILSWRKRNNLNEDARLF
jgi:hypothetical protein